MCLVGVPKVTVRMIMLKSGVKITESMNFIATAGTTVERTST